MKTSLREHHTDKDFGPLFTGEVLRDEAIAKVSDNNERWMDLCLREIHGMQYRTFTGEDIRHYLGARAGLPCHANAWGALISTLLRRKIIKPTGEYRAMRDSTSHARRTPVYQKYGT